MEEILHRTYWSCLLLTKGDFIEMGINNMGKKNNELVEKLLIQWKKLWHERIDDSLQAEKIAGNAYSSLFIEKGTIIHAS